MKIPREWFLCNVKTFVGEFRSEASFLLVAIRKGRPVVERAKLVKGLAAK